MYIIFLQNYSLSSSNNNEEVIDKSPLKLSLGLKIHEEEEEEEEEEVVEVLKLKQCSPPDNVSYFFNVIAYCLLYCHVHHFLTELFSFFLKQQRRSCSH
jgi:hypothetical protein